MDEIRRKRVEEELRDMIAALIIGGGVKDPRVGPFVSVTRVEVARDLSTARVFVSTFAGSDGDSGYKGLARRGKWRRISRIGGRWTSACRGLHPVAARKTSEDSIDATPSFYPRQGHKRGIRAYGKDQGSFLVSDSPGLPPPRVGRNPAGLILLRKPVGVTSFQALGRSNALWVRRRSAMPARSTDSLRDSRGFRRSLLSSGFVWRGGRKAVPRPDCLRS